MYPSGSGNPRHLHNDISPRTSSSPFSRPECQNDRANMPDLIDELGLRDSSSPRSYQDGAYAIRPGGVSTPGQACRAPWQRDWREHKSEQVSPPSQSAKHPNTPHHAESDGARAPKHFKQPLECFYWHTFGYCTKSDDECLYAHHDTGMVASAPINLGGGSNGSIAGRNAAQRIQIHAEREQQLREREAKLIAKEKELNDAIQSSSVTTMVEKVQQTIANVKAATDQTTSKLDSRRKEMNSAMMGPTCDSDVNITEGLDAALDLMKQVRREFDDLEEEIKGMLGQS